MAFNAAGAAHNDEGRGSVRRLCLNIRTACVHPRAWFNGFRGIPENNPATPLVADGAGHQNRGARCVAAPFALCRRHPKRAAVAAVTTTSIAAAITFLVLWLQKEHASGNHPVPPTPTATATPTPAMSATATFSPSPSGTCSVKVSLSPSESPTGTPSFSASVSFSPSPSASTSVSPQPILFEFKVPNGLLPEGVITDLSSLGFQSAFLPLGGYANFVFENFDLNSYPGFQLVNGSTLTTTDLKGLTSLVNSAIIATPHANATIAGFLYDADDILLKETIADPVEGVFKKAAGVGTDPVTQDVAGRQAMEDLYRGISAPSVVLPEPPLVIASDSLSGDEMHYPPGSAVSALSLRDISTLGTLSLGALAAYALTNGKVGGMQSITPMTQTEVSDRFDAAKGALGVAGMGVKSADGARALVERATSLQDTKHKGFLAPAIAEQMLLLTLDARSGHLRQGWQTRAIKNLAGFFSSQEQMHGVLQKFNQDFPGDFEASMKMIDLASRAIFPARTPAPSLWETWVSPVVEKVSQAIGLGH